MITFLFIAVVWLSDGSVDGATVVPSVSMAACKMQALQFEATVNAANASGPPGMGVTFHAECKAVANDSVREPS